MENINEFKVSICRLCLGTKPELNIFNQDPKLYHNIKLCCNIQMDESDNYPKRICLNCMDNITKAIDFRFMCESNDKILREKYFIKNRDYFVDSEYDENYEEVDMPSETMEIKVFDELNNDLKIKIEDDDADVDYFNRKIIKKEKYSKAKKIRSKTKSGNLKHKAEKSKRRKKNAETSETIDELDENSKQKQKNKKSLADKNTVTCLCSYCGMDLPKYKLSSHLRSHNAERKYQCDKCDRSFKCKTRLKDHMTVHTDVKTVSCTMCDQKLKYKSSLVKHMMAIHYKIRNAECELCGKKFLSKSVLNVHMKCHTQELTHQCEICHKMLRSKYSYEKHKRVHTGEKPWHCKFCDSKFTLRKSLTEHERLHTGVRPYTCPCCDKAFSQLSNMKSHFRNNHKDVNFDDVYKGKRMMKYV